MFTRNRLSGRRTNQVMMIRDITRDVRPMDPPSQTPPPEEQEMTIMQQPTPRPRKGKISTDTVSLTQGQQEYTTLPVQETQQGSGLSSSDKLKLSLLDKKLIKPKKTCNKPRKTCAGKIAIVGGKHMERSSVNKALNDQVGGLFKSMELQMPKLVPKSLKALIKNRSDMKLLIPEIGDVLTSALLSSFHAKHGRQMPKMTGSGLEVTNLRKAFQGIQRSILPDLQHLFKAYYKLQNGGGQLGGAFFKKLWKSVKKGANKAFKILKKEWRPIVKGASKAVLKYGLPALAVALEQPELIPAANITSTIAGKLIDRL